MLHYWFSCFSLSSDSVIKLEKCKWEFSWYLLNACTVLINLTSGVFFFFFKCSAPTSLHLQRIPKQLCVALCLSDFFFPLFLSETGSWGFWPHLDLSQCQEVVCSKRFHDTDLFPIYQIARSVNKVSTVFFHSCEITNGLLWGLIIKSFEFFFQGKSIIFPVSKFHCSII